MFNFEKKMWVALLSLFLVLLATLIWAFFGTVQVREEVSGILVKSGRIIHIYAPEKQTLLDISIQVGDYVESNQVIARIEQPELVHEINRLIKEHAAEEEIKKLRNQLYQASRIVTGDAGRVVDVFVHNGDYLEEGTKIATISKEASDKQSMECILYISIEQVKKIRKGMNVSIYPDFADTQEYGNMIGVVASVSDYPVTYQEIYDKAGNEELAAALLGEKACFAVTVHLETSEETVTGYKWTTSMGPSAQIGTLALCDASVLLKEMHPYEIFR